MAAVARSAKPADARHLALEDAVACAPASRRVGSGGLPLDRDDIWDRMVKPGRRLPSVALLEADLGPIHLDRLRQTGPVVLVFFPYASSEPANAALADYER